MPQRSLLHAALVSALQLSCAETGPTGVDCEEFGVPELSAFAILDDTLDLSSGSDTLHVVYSATGALYLWMLSAGTPSGDTVHLGSGQGDGFVLLGVDQYHSSGLRTPDAGTYQILTASLQYLARHCSTPTTDWDEDGFLDYTVGQLLSLGLSSTSFVVLNVSQSLTRPGFSGALLM